MITYERFLALALLVLAPALASKDQAQAAHKGHLLYLTLSAGCKHDSVPMSHDVVTEVGKSSGAFDVTLTDDVSPFTAENLKHYDAVVFYTTGGLPMNDEQKKASVDFVRSGH